MNARKPYKNYRTDGLHPTRVQPETQQIKSITLTLVKNMGRTLIAHNLVSTIKEALEFIQKVIPFLRQVCYRCRPQWVSAEKYRKGLMNLIGTTESHKEAYRPGSPLELTRSPERRAGMRLALKLWQNPRPFRDEAELERAIKQEIRRLWNR
jgi:hypothetical protein